MQSNKLLVGLMLIIGQKPTHWCAKVPETTVVDNYFKYDAYLSNTNASRLDPTQEVQGREVRAIKTMNSYLSLATLLNGQTWPMIQHP